MGVTGIPRLYEHEPGEPFDSLRLGDSVSRPWLSMPVTSTDIIKVGGALSLSMSSSIPMTSEKVVLHSDRGVQYTADEFQAFLNTHGIVSSMSGVGNCDDNAVAESFFGLLKRERVHRRHYLTRAETRRDIFDYIERFYNRQRRHSHSQGLPPEIYAKTEVTNS